MKMLVNGVEVSDFPYENGSLKQSNGLIVVHMPTPPHEAHNFEIKTQQPGEWAAGRRVAYHVWHDGAVIHRDPLGFVLADGTLGLWNKHKSNQFYRLFAKLINYPQYYGHPQCKHGQFKYLFYPHCLICNQALPDGQACSACLGGAQ